MTARLDPKLEAALRLLASRSAEGVEGVHRFHLGELLAEVDRTRADLAAVLNDGTPEWGVKLAGYDHVQSHDRPGDAVKVADELVAHGETPQLLHRWRMFTAWQPCTHPNPCTCTPEEGSRG